MEKLLLLLLMIQLASLTKIPTIQCKNRIDSIDATTDYYECLPGDAVIYRCSNERTSMGDVIGNRVFEKVALWNTCKNQTIQLDLIKDGITTLNKWNLIGYPNLKVLNLSHNFIRDLDVNVFDHLNQLKVLNLSFNELISLEPDVVSWIDDLDTLDLSHNRLTDIDDSALNGLDNLKELNLASNGIMDIKLSLISLKKLERLNLSHNALKDFNFDNFRDNPNIEILDLSFNNMRGTAKPVMFEGLKSLKYLDLSQNQIFKIESGSFAGLNLYYFDISDNLLSGDLLADTFEGLKTTHLDISAQNISGIKDDAFNGSEWITRLNLSSNIITNLEENSLFGLPSLKQLDLTGNKLSKFDVNVSGLIDLEELNLSGNEIGNIKFHVMPYLMTLDLSFNKIHILKPGAFENLTNLESLNLAHNSIVHMAGGAFRGLLLLTSLDLSFNNFYYMDGSLVSGLENLRYLNIDNNHLRKFEIKSLIEGKILDKPITLSINDNPLECEWLKTTLIYAKYNSSFIVDQRNETYTTENAEEIECFETYKKFDFTSKNTPKENPDKSDVDTREMREEVTRILADMQRQNEFLSSSGLIIGMGVVVIVLAAVILGTYHIYHKKEKFSYSPRRSGNFVSL